MTTHRHDFNSFEEFIDVATDDTKPRHRSQSRDNGRDFTGTGTFHEAVELARYGWREGLEAVVSASADACISAQGRAPAISIGVAGYAPNVALAVMNVPECMYSRGDEFNAGTPVVSVTVFCGMNASIETRQVMNRGAALMGIIDFLESQDMRVEVNGLFYNTGGGHVQHITFPIKKADEPLERDRLIFSIGHPSVHRRFVFALIEQNPALRRPFGDWYGSSNNPPAEVLSENAVYLPKLEGSQCWTQEDAATQILEQFETVLTADQMQALHEATHTGIA